MEMKSEGAPQTRHLIGRRQSGERGEKSRMRRRPADGAQRAWENPARSGRRRPGALARAWRGRARRGRGGARRRRETARRRQGCRIGPSGRRRARSGVAGAGGRGRGTRAGGAAPRPRPHTCGAEAGAAGSRSARALGGELRLTCAVSRGKRAARGQGESVSGVVRREARRAAGGHKLEDNLRPSKHRSRTRDVAKRKMKTAQRPCQCAPVSVCACGRQDQASGWRRRASLGA